MGDTPTVKLPDGVTTFTPHDIAVLAFGETHAFKGAKLVRDYLRAAYRRDLALKNTSWLLDRDVAQDVLDAMTSRKTATTVTLEDKTSDA